MNIKKKNFIFCLIGMFIFATLLSCGIFALADSVKFKLGITLKPSVYFALSLNINNTGEQWIFDNRPTSANSVVDWASVKNLTLTLNNDAISTADSMELKVYNYNQNKYMSFEVYDTSGGVLSVQKNGIKNLSYNSSGSLNLKTTPISNDLYIFKINVEIYNEILPKHDVYLNGFKYDTAYYNHDYTTTLDYYDQEAEINVTGVKINDIATNNYSFSSKNVLTIFGEYITGDIKITSEIVKGWDGVAATTFGGGSGTSAEPYLIYTPDELCKLANDVNSGTTYSGSYFKLMNNIKLNDETFTIDFDTGLVEATDGSNTVYIGTTLKGDTTGSNATFDTTASTMGNFYASQTATTYTAPTTTYGTDGVLNLWPSIGNSSYAFAGTFEGNGYEVSGIYINSTGTSTTTDCYKGLFGKISGTVQNIGVVNGYVRGFGGTAAVCGYGGLLKNSYGCAIVQADICGGVNCESVNTQYCFNTGTVIAAVNAGGLSRGATSISYCYNGGKVFQTAATSTGLNTNECRAAGIVAATNSGNTNNCVNIGLVKGTTQTAGAICASTWASSFSNNYYLPNTSYLGTSVSVGQGANYAITSDFARVIFAFGTNSDFSASVTTTSSLLTSLAVNSGQIYLVEYLPNDGWYVDKNYIGADLPSDYGITLTNFDSAERYKIALCLANV